MDFLDVITIFFPRMR